MMLPVVTLLVAAALPQVVEEINKDSDTITLVFDHPQKATDGTDVVLDAAEFIFAVNPIVANPVPPPIRVLRDMQPLVLGANAYRVRSLFVGVPTGEYDITVRVRSDSGAWSASSNVLHRKIISKKPVAPTNLREGVGL